MRLLRAFLCIAALPAATLALPASGSEARRSAIVIAVESQKDSVVNIPGQ